MVKRSFLAFCVSLGFVIASFGLVSVPSGVMADSGSLARAVEQVKRRTGGKILSANTSREGKRKIHNIRVLTQQGRVKRFRVDARSGQFLNPRQDRHAPPSRRR